MIKALIALLLLTLATPATAAAPAQYHTYLAIGQQQQTVLEAPAAQPCTFETAPAKLRAEITDPLGIPYGNVQAWSCDGDGLAVANELAQRAAAMRDAAAAYRAAHPIGRAP